MLRLRAVRQPDVIADKRTHGRPHQEFDRQADGDEQHKEKERVVACTMLRPIESGANQSVAGIARGAAAT